MSNKEQSPKATDKHWESVHTCPQCGHIINLAEIDLRTIATGIITCPKCGWSGPVAIAIVEDGTGAE